MLRFPRMWTYFDYQCPAKFQAYKSRVQGMPLSLVIDTGNIPITRPQTDVLMDNWDACATQRAQMALSAITECSPQPRRLDLIASGRDLDLTSELFDIGVPNLECLTVWLPCFRFKSHFEHLGPLSRPGFIFATTIEGSCSLSNQWLAPHEQFHIPDSPLRLL